MIIATAIFVSAGCANISTDGLYAFDDRATAPIDSKEFKEFCADRGIFKQSWGLAFDTATWTLGEVDEIVNSREVAESNPVTQSFNRKCEGVE